MRLSMDNLIIRVIGVGVCAVLAATSCKSTESAQRQDTPPTDTQTAEQQEEFEESGLTPVEVPTTIKIQVIQMPDDVYDTAALMTPVYFSFEKAELDLKSKAMLKEIALWMQEHPGTSITLVGHTDTEGTTTFNEELGMARAMSAKAYLLELGVNEERLAVKSLGETQPAIKTEQNIKHWRNRRVEFEVSESPVANR